MVPAQGAEFFGARAGQQREHHIGVQASSLGGAEDSLRPGGAEGLGGSALLASRNGAQRGDVALHLVPGHGSVHRAVEAPVEVTKGTGAEGGGFVG